MVITLSHEIGHYFSLTIPSSDGKPILMTAQCQPLTTLPQRPEGIGRICRSREAIFKQQLHCNVSADGFCDTPADYNLGFGFNGCKYSAALKDPDDVPPILMAFNIMSYFSIV
ncbi:MAG: hypothetical protein U0T81_02150 [Saprospiraceae bacterium]